MIGVHAQSRAHNKIFVSLYNSADAAVSLRERESSLGCHGEFLPDKNLIYSSNFISGINMSKTAPTSKPAHVQAADKHNETDKAFLERNHVKSILNNLLETLNRHQPDDPLNFIYT